MTWLAENLHSVPPKKQIVFNFLFTICGITPAEERLPQGRHPTPALLPTHEAYLRSEVHQDNVQSLISELAEAKEENNKRVSGRRTSAGCLRRTADVQDADRKCCSPGTRVVARTPQFTPTPWALCKAARECCFIHSNLPLGSCGRG